MWSKTYLKGERMVKSQVKDSNVILQLVWAYDCKEQGAKVYTDEDGCGNIIRITITYPDKSIDFVKEEEK